MSKPLHPRASQGIVLIVIGVVAALVGFLMLVTLDDRDSPSTALGLLAGEDDHAAQRDESGDGEQAERRRRIRHAVRRDHLRRRASRAPSYLDWEPPDGYRSWLASAVNRDDDTRPDGDVVHWVAADPTLDDPIEAKPTDRIDRGQGSGTGTE